MIDSGSVNYLAIVVSAIVAMALGFVWYSKAVFGKTWMKEVGKTQEDLKKGGSGGVYAVMFVAALVFSFVLAKFIAWTGTSTAVEGMKIGLWAWLGFALTGGLGMHMFEGRSMKLYYINMGYYLVEFAILGTILGAWQ